MKKIAVILLTSILFLACREELQPRFPVWRTYHKDYTASIYFNKKLFLAEQKLFDSIEKHNPDLKFYKNSSGMRYYYLKKNDTADYHPKKGDWVRLNYGVYYIEGDTIYTPEEVGTVHYQVDKQEIFTGLGLAVKQLKEGEEAFFFIPSYLGYGLLGDGDRISGNTPLKVYLKIQEIKSKKDTL